jgi:hypothetical protein
MAINIESTTVDTTTDYRLLVTRQDNGVATMKFFYKGVEQTTITATAAGWDDAVPWAAKTYYAEGGFTKSGIATALRCGTSLTIRPIAKPSSFTPDSRPG